jgi:hypothetical protein
LPKKALKDTILYFKKAKKAKWPKKKSYHNISAKWQPYSCHLLVIEVGKGEM